ncbi:MAG: HAMP domain-containing protein [Sphingobium sp.]|nr:HAMP domain-containing protein [Sphingobium sp.]
MSIKKLVMIASAVMVLLMAVGAVWGSIRINEIRMGGPIQTNTQYASDLIADILPPPEYVIEPYLEASLLVRDPASLDHHTARLEKLRSDYEERHKFWLQTKFDADLQKRITQDTHKPAMQFWSLLNTDFLPAVRSGDPVAIDVAFGRLTEAYETHRKAVDVTVQKATEYQMNLKTSAESRLHATMVILGTLIAALFGLVLTFCCLVRFRVLAPITRLAQQMNRMAQGDMSFSDAEEERRDEIGEVNRALHAIVDHVAEKSAREANEAMAVQQHIVSELGIALTQLREGVLTHRIAADFPPEYISLREDYNAAITSVETAIGEVNDAVEALNSSAGEITAATQDLSQRTEHQAANLEETAATMQQLTQRVQQAADASQSVSGIMGEVQQQADDNGRVVTDAIKAMGEIEESATSIGQIINVIDGIAFQTNLLALNAGVEAARAGDAGKGFAVVANEVRALAQRCADAASDIKSLISDSNSHVEGGVVLVRQSGDALGQIMERVGEVSKLVEEIAKSSADQAEGFEHVNDAISSIDHMTQQNAAMGEECNAASRVLKNEAGRLSDMVRRFRIGQASEPVDYDLPEQLAIAASKAA